MAAVPLVEKHAAAQIKAEMERDGTTTVGAVEVGLFDRRILLTDLRSRQLGEITIGRWQASGLAWPLDELIKGRTPVSGLQLGDPLQADRLELNDLHVVDEQGELVGRFPGGRGLQPRTLRSAACRQRQSAHPSRRAHRPGAVDGAPRAEGYGLHGRQGRHGRHRHRVDRSVRQGHDRLDRDHRLRCHAQDRQGALHPGRRLQAHQSRPATGVHRDECAGMAAGHAGRPGRSRCRKRVGLRRRGADALRHLPGQHQLGDQARGPGHQALAACASRASCWRRRCAASRRCSCASPCRRWA